ncbi:bcl-2-like protein 2 [Mixophyes fleayi]|uniref:bcl-2-like protein 2 n=1 Tax=Mixophyes fleayi TaxID=3061075 RepID=UPI003F4DA212
MAELNNTDPVVREAYQLSHDSIAYVTGRAAGPAPSAATLALRHAGDELLEKFPIFFKRWPRVFSGVTDDNACDLLVQIIDENIKGHWDRQRRQPGYPPDLPWSSVLSIYVLAGQMATYCQENGLENVLQQLPERLGGYVEEHICPVLRKKDGWVGFTERFSKKEETERKVLRVCSAVLAACSVLLLTHFLWRRMSAL